jgi:acetoacetate decarboxylase
MFSLNKEEFDRLRKAGYVSGFTAAEMLFVRFRTSPEFVASVLPRPLRPPADPLGVAFVGLYPQTNFGVTYNEGAVLLDATYRGEQGRYCLSMPVTDDMAMLYGREFFGYPKKIAESITLTRGDDTVVGSVVRKGTEILHLEAELTDAATERDLDVMGSPTVGLDGQPCRSGLTLQFKHLQTADFRRFEFIPHLIRHAVLWGPREDIRVGTAKMTLTSTGADPLGDIPIRDVLGSLYGTWDNQLIPGRTVGRAWNMLRYGTQSAFKTDIAQFLLTGPLTRPQTRQERRDHWHKIRTY